MCNKHEYYASILEKKLPKKFGNETYSYHICHNLSKKRDYKWDASILSWSMDDTKMKYNPYIAIKNWTHVMIILTHPLISNMICKFEEKNGHVDA